jgi:hypothetical protein
MNYELKQIFNELRQKNNSIKKKYFVQFLILINLDKEKPELFRQIIMSLEKIKEEDIFEKGNDKVLFRFY